MNDMQLRSNELLFVNNQFSTDENFNIIKNLEQQLDSLNEVCFLVRLTIIGTKI